MNRLSKLVVLFLIALTFNPRLLAQDEETDRAIQEMAQAMQTFRRQPIKGLDTMREIYRNHGDDERISLTFVQSLQRLAKEILKQNREAANPYFFEAGNVARKIELNENSPPTAAQLIASSIYNEASSYSVIGNKEKALESLQMAFEKGYDQFDQALADTDFGDLLETDEFKQVIADAKLAVTNREVESVESELSSFESFDFDMDTVDMHGNDITLTGMQGKVVMLHMWATSNQASLREIPNLIQLQKKYGDDLQVFGVAYEDGDDEDKAHEAVVEYMEANNMNYQSALGDDDFREQIVGLKDYPATIFVDAEGTVRYTSLGAISMEKSEAILKLLMADDSE